MVQRWINPLRKSVSGAGKYYLIEDSVLHYEFLSPDSDMYGGTVLDRSLAGNDGVGVGRWAFSFDGAANRLAFNTARPLIADGSYVGVWLKPSGLTGTYKMILSPTNTSTDYIAQNDDDLQIVVTKAAFGNLDHTFTGFFTDTSWVHLGVTFDNVASGIQVNVYKNGVLFESYTNAEVGNAINAQSTLYVGGGQFGPVAAGFFSGEMRDLCQFGSDVEVADVPYSIDTSTATRFFAMDEGSGTVLSDLRSADTLTDRSTGGWDMGENSLQDWLEDDGAGGSEEGSNLNDSILFADQMFGIDAGKPADFNFDTDDFTVIVVMKAGFEWDTTADKTCLLDNCDANNIGITHDNGFGLWHRNSTNDLSFGIANGSSSTQADLTPSYHATEPSVIIAGRHSGYAFIQLDSSHVSDTYDASGWGIQPEHNTVIWSASSDDDSSPVAYNRLNNAQTNIAAVYIVNRKIEAAERATIVADLKARYA